MAEEKAKPPARGFRLNLGTLEASRKSYTRLIRMMARHEIDRDDFRALAYGMNGLLQYWHSETEIEIKARIEAIEGALAKIQREGIR